MIAFNGEGKDKSKDKYACGEAKSTELRKEKFQLNGSFFHCLLTLPDGKVFDISIVEIDRIYSISKGDKVIDERIHLDNPNNFHGYIELSSLVMLDFIKQKARDTSVIRYHCNTVLPDWYKTRVNAPMKYYNFDVESGLFAVIATGNDKLKGEYYVFICDASIMNHSSDILALNDSFVEDLNFLVEAVTK